MAYIAKPTSKQMNTTRVIDRSLRGVPQVAFQAESTWIQQQLTQAPPSQRERLARQIVEALSPDALRALPGPVRRLLRDQLSKGRITAADRQAVSKLLEADVVQLQFQPGLLVKGPHEFVAKTREHLTQLAQLPIGRKLFRSLQGSGKTVQIVPAARVSEAPPDDFKAAVARGKQLRWRELSGREKCIKGTGEGSNTTIKYNPDAKHIYVSEAWSRNPPAIDLAHELIHADDAAYGRLDPEETGGVRNYERQAIGLAPYENKEFTENKFRASWRQPLPMRTSY